MQLNKNILRDSNVIFENNSEYRSCWNAKGLYNSMQFVLRLRPDIHKLLDRCDIGIVKSGDIDFDTFQAFSTYLHETIHWWQHIGSTSGLILSMTYPSQAHLNHKHLNDFLKYSGKKKSILKFYELNVKPEIHDSSEFQTINRILNNFFDIEFYRSLVVNPSNAEDIVNDKYFECMGHSFDIAYSSVLNVLSNTFDPECEYFPDPRKWEKKFMKLREDKHTGYFYKSDIHLSPIGLKELFEGQARFIQIQYLYFGSGEKFNWDDFREMGMLSGVYVKAFEIFIESTESDWPVSIDDPLVALFLLICDISMNPSDGFPFDIYHFESFIESTDPGTRFIYLCRIIATQHSSLKTKIVEYSKEEYIEVCEILCKSIVTATPLDIAHKVVSMSEQSAGLIKLLKEGETFCFFDENLPIRVIYDRFIRYNKDKIKSPHLFCWAGVWAAGKKCSEEFMELFLEHQSLFSDKADGDIYPRSFPDKEEKIVQKTFDSFYSWNTSYDLCRQWIVDEGPFNYDYFWLTSKHSMEELSQWAKRNFEAAYKVNPDEFEIF